MKFIFSIGVIVILYFTPSEAKDVILFSYHPSQVTITKALKRIMHERMDFPKDLVEFIESENPCYRKEVSAAHICIKSNGDMEFPIIYTKTMRETLGIFWKDVKDEIENK